MNWGFVNQTIKEQIDDILSFSSSYFLLYGLHVEKILLVEKKIFCNQVERKKFNSTYQHQLIVCTSVCEIVCHNTRPERVNFFVCFGFSFCFFHSSIRCRFEQWLLIGIRHSLGGRRFDCCGIGRNSWSCFCCFFRL